MKNIANRTGIGRVRWSRELNGIRRALGGLLMLSLAGSAAEGYLPRLGPAPMRFHSGSGISDRYASFVSMVDPISPSPGSETMTDPPIKEGVDSNAVPANATFPLDPPKTSDPGGPETNRIETATSAGSTMPTGGLVFGPQMLLQYFPVRSAAGNGATDVLIPFNFMPPQPWVHPSSTAVITNPPPENK